MSLSSRGAVLGALLLGIVLSACSAATQQPSPAASATVEALNTQVVSLNRQLEQLQPTATSVAAPALPPTRPPTAEPTEEPTATPEPAADPTPRIFPTRMPRPITASDAAPCNLGQIKGNRSSKIYHVPGGGSYSQTKANVECFDTEAQAQAAGYRRARN